MHRGYTRGFRRFDAPGVISGVQNVFFELTLPLPPERRQDPSCRVKAYSPGINSGVFASQRLTAEGRPRYTCALESTGSALEASALESTPERFGGECFGEHCERFGGDCFGEHKRVLWSVSSSVLEMGDLAIESRLCMLFRAVPTKAKSSMPGKNRALKGKMWCVGVRQLQQAISGAAGEVSSAPGAIWSASEALGICSEVVRELQEHS
ncbi:hypothetical protein DFP73DRAFT_601392 [Morchella snyderi]|nr:hypothetical protein DFP73DRAFT_601392 [Morchella snyderi]